MTRAFQNTDETFNADGLSFSLHTLKIMIYLTLVAPLMITFIFVDELAYNMIRDYVSFTLWQMMRLVPVFIYAVMRVALFRDEVQFQFD